MVYQRNTAVLATLYNHQCQLPGTGMASAVHNIALPPRCHDGLFASAESLQHLGSGMEFSTAADLYTSTSQKAPRAVAYQGSGK